MKYKAILLDLDNTIYEYEPNHQLALGKVIEYFSENFGFSTKQTQDFFDKSRKSISSLIPNTASSHNRLLYFQTMCEMAKIQSSLHAMTLYNLYWDNFLNNMSLSRYVEDFLIFCQGKKIKIALVTDLTAHIQYRKIAKLGIDKYIDFVITSEETGIDKPDKSMFLRALEKLDLMASDVCMIGDNYEKDIMGAKSLGIDAIWLNNEVCDKMSCGDFLQIQNIVNNA